jgi:hypothetical protein
MSNFKEVCTVPTDFGVTFTKLKSEKTGLTVMLADIEGLKCMSASGYIRLTIFFFFFFFF